MYQLQKLVLKLRRWLHQPRRVFLFCATVFVLTLFLNGTLWKIWGLTKDKKNIQEQIQQAQVSIFDIEKQMKQAKDPYFIERQARDKMDMVSENDLIFVFPD